MLHLQETCRRRDLGRRLLPWAGSIKNCPRLHEHRLSACWGCRAEHKPEMIGDVSLLVLFSRSLGGTRYARSVQIVSQLIFRESGAVAPSSEPDVRVGLKEQTLYVSCLF